MGTGIEIIPAWVWYVVAGIIVIGALLLLVAAILAVRGARALIRWCTKGARQ